MKDREYTDQDKIRMRIKEFNGAEFSVRDFSSDYGANVGSRLIEFCEEGELVLVGREQLVPKRKRLNIYRELKLSAVKPLPAKQVIEQCPENPQEAIANNPWYNAFPDMLRNPILAMSGNVRVHYLL